MDKSSRLVVLNASQIVTLSGTAGPRRGVDLQDVGLFKNSAMVCSNGKIEWIGPSTEIKSRTSAEDEVIDATGCVVLPGFVDSHTHPIYGGDRLDEFSLRASGASYQTIAAAGGGILSTVRKTRVATEDELISIGAKHARLFLANGTTTIEAKSGYGLDTGTELRMMRAMRRLGESTPMRIVPTFLGAHALPPEFDGNKAAYLETVLDTLTTVSTERLADYCDMYVEPGYFDAEDARRLSDKADLLGLKLRLHVDQFSDSGGARLAAELNALSADHLEYTGDDGISALASSGVVPVLLPASVYCLGLTKYPNARAMIEKGLPVVIASDFNPGSSPTLSMPFVMSLCCTQMCMSPEETLVAATINPAHLLGLSDRIGSLECGKVADFTIWPTNDWRELMYLVGSLRPDQVFSCGRNALKRL